MEARKPLTLERGARVLRNRAVLAAMTNKQSGEDGVLSDEEIRWLLRRAEGGFGVITTAASHVLQGGKSWEGEMGVWGDHQIPGLKQLASGIRSMGSVGLVQIFHGGLRAPRSLTGSQPVSASANHEKGVEEESRELEGAEVESIVKSFAEAASRCEKSGFDGIEIHAAHGYLICQFLGQKTNRREDKWGGSLEGRARFLREIVESVRSETSDDFLVSVRISPEIPSIGVNLPESIELAKMLTQMEVDVLHISCWDAFAASEEETDDPRTLTRRFREAIPADFPLLSTGSIWSTKDAEFVIREGADLVGVARAAIAHPNWPIGLSDPDFDPQRPPFTPEHLEEADLSPIFIDYMRRWRGFVTDGRGD